MTCSNGMRSDEIPSTPQPKPRLEIIHPLELDGAAVQVVRNEKSEDVIDFKFKNQNSLPSVHSPQHVAGKFTTIYLIIKLLKFKSKSWKFIVRPSKPPPPPRTQSLDGSSKPLTTSPKQQQQQQQSSNGNKSLGKSWQPSGSNSSSGGSSASDSIYANLGKFRPIQCN